MTEASRWRDIAFTTFRSLPKDFDPKCVWVYIGQAALGLSFTVNPRATRMLASDLHEDR